MKFFLFLAISIITLTGCVGHLDGQTYSRDQARQAASVEYGTIEGMTPVVLEGTNSYVGTVAGAIIGGLAGNSVGGGTGRKIATVAGAVAGSVAGKTAEEHMTRAQGTEFIIQKDSGRTIAVVQENNPNITFNVGDRIRLISTNGELRISPVR